MATPPLSAWIQGNQRLAGHAPKAGSMHAMGRLGKHLQRELPAEAGW